MNDSSSARSSSVRASYAKSISPPGRRVPRAYGPDVLSLQGPQAALDGLPGTGQPARRLCPILRDSWAAVPALGVVGRSWRQLPADFPGLADRVLVLRPAGGQQGDRAATTTGKPHPARDA